MAFFSHNLIHSITYSRPASTVDVNGVPTSIGAQVTAPAKVKYEKNTVRDPDNNEVVTEHVIVTEADVLPRDRVWVPFWGDNIAVVGDARHAVAVRKTESISGDATLTRVFL